MPIRNTQQTYGSVAKFLHWLTAICAIILLCVGVSLHYLPKGELKTTIIQAHKSGGVTLLILMILRLLWRWTNPQPMLPSSLKRWEKVLAKSVHRLLYLAVIVMPISGIVMTYAAGYSIKLWWLYPIHLPWIPKNKALATFAHSAHGYIAGFIVALITLHTLAALKHLLINKDGVFQRMWPTSKKSRSCFH